MAEGLGIQSTARALDVDANTVQDWLSQAAEHMEAVSNYLMRELNLSQVRVDELWALLGKRDELAPQKRNTRWVWSATDPESKLWLGFLIADRSLESAQVFIHGVSQLLAPDCVPFLLSDRYKPYATAILTHFGHWVLSLPTPIPTKGNGSPKLWEPRTPAMAAGITDHVWSMEELLLFRAPPYHQPMPQKQAA